MKMNLVWLSGVILIATGCTQMNGASSGSAGRAEGSSVDALSFDVARGVRMASISTGGGNLITLTAVHSKLMLTSGNAAGATVTQQASSPTAAGQVFEVSYDQSGAARFVDHATGLCLGVKGRVGEALDPLQLINCDASMPSQVFLPKVLADSSFELRPFAGATNFCLDVETGSTAPGLRLIQYPCTGGGNQHFIITPVAPAVPAISASSIQAQHSALLLTAGAVGGAVVQSGPASNAGAQQFQAIKVSENVFRFANALTGGCLGIDGAAGSDWAPLKVLACDTASTAQKFLLNSAAGGFFEIRPFAGTRPSCLDVATASTAPGTALIQYTCNQGTNQRFKLNLPTGSSTTAPVSAAPVASAPSTPKPDTSNVVSIASPAANASLTGTVTLAGSAGSAFKNISAYDKSSNYKQIAGNVSPSNGVYSLNIDSTQMTNGTHVISVIGFTVPAGQSGGTSVEATVSVNVQNTVVAPPVAVTPAAISGLNYQLSFEDKFTTNTISLGDTWDGSKWYNGTEQCCMVDSTGLPAVMFPTAVNSVSINPYSLIAGGGLNIDLIKQNNVWYSGVLTSVDKNKKGFTQQYGYFEAVAKMPSGDGVWPAFWLLSTDPNMPGEIDVMEYYGHDQGKTYGITLHDWRNGGNNSNIPNAQKFPQVSGMMDDYHAYGMLWTATEMKFYYDAQLVWTVPTPDVMKQPYYVLVNMGLGGYWPTDRTPSKQTFQIKSIRAYRAP